MKKYVLTKVPESFVRGQMMNDAKQSIKKFTNKQNITNADAFRFLEESYTHTNKIKKNQDKFSFEVFK